MYNFAPGPNVSQSGSLSPVESLFAICIVEPLRYWDERLVLSFSGFG